MQGTKKSNFAKTPIKSEVTLITNNFKIKSKNKGIIYTYQVEFVEQVSLGENVSVTTGEEEEKKSHKALAQDGSSSLQTFQKFKIIRDLSDSLKKIFAQYVFVGTNLFSLTELDQRIVLESKKLHFSRQYSVVLQLVSQFSMEELNTMKMEQHPVALSFINSIVKSSLRNSNLTQIGRNPRFFMPQAATRFNQLETWPGFFTSSWIFQQGLYLVIDNISKFLSVDHCLAIINDRLKKISPNEVNREFEGQIVMAKYGSQRTYKVHSIRWDLSPQTYVFDQGDDLKKISMLQYFLTVYDIKIKDTKQPLFEIKQKKQNIYLPTEQCILVGIPQNIRENKRLMADIRQSLFQKPEQRVQSIKELNNKIANSKEIRDWDLTIEAEPDELKAKVLKKPSIISPFGDKEGNIYQLDDPGILRTIVHQPVHFEKWAIFCLERDTKNGKFIQEQFYELSKKENLKIFIEFADVISLKNNSTIDHFKAAIDSYYNEFVLPELSSNKKGGKKSPLFFFMIIIPDFFRQGHFYQALKNKINSDSPVISQFVQSKTIFKNNNRIFTNIVRQINAKLGGDLWRLSFGQEISKKTMLVGIDVCHKGRQSIIGFVATYDPYLCKYYTQASPQKQKGQEIISNNILTEYFQNSFQAYRDYNKGALPDQIFIYRDGVGDAMRKLVLEKELQQLKKIIEDEYALGTSSAQPQPHITLIIVNKRVRQRFFERVGKNITNPPQGTYVDKGFVEQSEVVDGKFDFFLVPHSVTQGAVKPTHFYVAENTSKISKDAILNFTYSLCYNYFNWPDSIKIPAPCMLADKIALYRTEIGNIPSNIDLHRLPYFL